DEERIKIHQFALLEGFLIASKANRYEEPSSLILEEHNKTLANEDSTSYERSYAKKVINTAKEPIDWRSGIVLEDIIKRVEMAEQFNLSDKNS
ncbi:MAG: hypothetical protein OEL55_05960, partial [Desulfobulbaceae bacterium]|nr:hypothetical protein [Desulfobulbaceae bacterium]